ncbi:tetratricopeptide repeat protein [PVC group bacterium]|nr:tetratricopeptide repeat protein [PVC group bacterium]
MKNINTMLPVLRLTALFAIVVMSVTPMFAGDQHKAMIIKKGGRGKVTGMVRWLGATRAYEVQAGRARQQVAYREVEKIVLAKPPPQLAQAARGVQRKQYASAIPVLKKIRESYEMLGPDLEATRWLADAYLGLNQVDNAVKMCEEVFRENPGAMTSGDLAGIYWQALIKKGEFTKLRRILSDAVETGSREVAAVAQIRRGDIDKEKGNLKKALQDGYLRTIILFQDIKSVQPEALFKAIECHETLNEFQHAEKWRKRLLAGYPNSGYAKKLK